MKQFDFMKDPDTQGSDSITVENTPKRKLNLFPRIACMLVALGIWIYMFNMNKDDITTEIELQVEIIGAEVLEESGKMYYGFDQNAVTITVQGTNRDLRQYKASDYKATVDVSGIIENGVNNISIKIESPTNLNVVDKSITSVGVIVDDVSKKDVANIEVVLNSADAVELAGELNLDTLPVIGASTLITNLASIEIFIDGDVKEGDNITYSDIVADIYYYDKNGKEIVSKGGISIDTEKLKEIGETLNVTIVEIDPADSSESDESAESESVEAE